VTAVLASVIAVSTLAQVVGYAVVAGLGVMGAFSALIYCVERALTLRRADRRAAAALYQAGSTFAMMTVVAIVVYGLVLITSKPK
jgi:hypothetical protein